MSKKLSIIICAYNEKDSILSVIDRVQRADYGDWVKELVIVDNCSTDGTRELLQDISFENTKVIYQPENMGKGTSIRTAIDNLTGDYAVIQDADLEYDPQDIAKLLAKADEGAVAVFGSRTLEGQAIYRYAHAYWGVKAITLTMNLLFGGNLTDAATATKMVRADVLKSLHLVGKSFDLDFELPDKLLLAGVRIEEVKISYNPRTYDEGKKIKPQDGLEAFLIMLRDRMGLSPVWKKDISRPDLSPTPITESGR